MKLRHCAFIILAFLFTSCVSIYFDRPQPVDAKDMKKVPSTLRGTWIEGFDTTVISKKAYYQSDWYIDTVLKVVFDTTPSLEIRDGLIFDMENDPLTGYAYKEMDDHMIVYVPDATQFNLSDSARLRKISKQYFTFNARKANEWWEVFLIEKTEVGSINIRYPKESDLDILRSMDSGREVIVEQGGSEDLSLITNEFQKFWEVELTKDQMLDLIDQGGFSDTILILDIASRQ